MCDAIQDKLDSIQAKRERQGEQQLSLERSLALESLIPDMWNNAGNLKPRSQWVHSWSQGASFKVTDTHGKETVFSPHEVPETLINGFLSTFTERYGSNARIALQVKQKCFTDKYPKPSRKIIYNALH